jgi:hypothetical protein
VRALGRRTRFGDEYFNLGRGTQVRSVTAADGEAVLLTANALSDVRAWRGLAEGRLTEVPLLVCATDDGPTERIGGSGTGLCDKFRYTAPLPHADGRGWDLLLLDHLDSRLMLCRRCPGVSELRFRWPKPLHAAAGVPETVDWRRDGTHDLLLAQRDGTLLRLPRERGAGEPHFTGPGIPVTDAGGMPIELRPPIFPCRVDVSDAGRSDLLIGTGDGFVLLFRDIGEAGEVRYARGRLLADPQGVIELPGPVSATLHRAGGREFLAAVDGEGALWTWPLEPRESHSLRIEGAGGGRSLRLAPPLRGPCEVHLDIRRAAPGGDAPETLLRVGDAPAAILSAGETAPAPLASLYAGTFHLAGGDLFLTELKGSAIERVRLLALPAPAPPRTRAPRVPVAGIFDTGMWPLPWETPEAVEEVVEWHRQAGFDTLHWKLGGGYWEYPSRVPEAESAPLYEGLPAGKAERNRLCVERVNAIHRPQLAVGACHKRGMKCFGWIRLQNHGEHLGRYPVDRFYLNHPEFLEKDIFGRPVAGKLCLGYPEVREYHLRIVAEALDFGVDGIMMETLRHLPKVMWGDPVRESFRHRHGVEMRDLPPFDARVVEHQCGLFTEFLREVRALMRRKNAAAQLHLRVGKAEPLMGCHPAQWAREGIADALMIEHRATVQKRPDIGGMVAACAGTACAPMAVFARSRWGAETLPLHPWRVRAEVRDYLAAGAKGIAFYETAEIVARPDLCRAIRRINAPEEPESVMV